jgi:hypothetical protein
MRCVAAALVMACLLPGVGLAQTAKRPAPKSSTAKATAAAPATKTEAAVVTCPAQLGEGVRTGRTFCDVLTGRHPAEGMRIAIPPHSGTAALTFDLHNRHTYSEEQVRAGKAFAEYTATIGVLLPDGTLLTRAAVKSTFRTAADLVDRVGGGAGPGGVKAVAPVGTEPIRVEIPAQVTEVSLLGERLVIERIDGRDNFTSTGRPVAIVSNVQVEYRPVKASKPAAKKPATKAPAKKTTTKKK